MFNFQRNFICRSAEYNYVTLQCRLSDYDRRTVDPAANPVDLVEAAGVDYFENLCLSSAMISSQRFFVQLKQFKIKFIVLGENACEISRSYQIPKFGIPDTKVAVHAGVHFYVDKELLVKTENWIQFFFIGYV